MIQHAMEYKRYSHKFDPLKAGNDKPMNARGDVLLHEAHGQNTKMGKANENWVWIWGLCTATNSDSIRNLTHEPHVT